MQQQLLTQGLTLVGPFFMQDYLTDYVSYFFSHKAWQTILKAKENFFS